MPESFLAMIAMPRLQVEAITTTGSPAAAPRIAAAMPNAPKSTDLVTTAFLHSVGVSNGSHLDLVARGHELIVEVGRDRMDQFQRAGADHDRLALRAQNGRRGQ